MTPHINAKKEDIAKIVLMPGDPLRAKFIAEKYLKNVKLVNEIRNMFMFTGEYNGTKVTIAGSGMGMPSMGIYSYELFNFYDVDTIIRIGSSGSYSADLKVYDLVLAKAAFSTSTYARDAIGSNENVLYPSTKVNNTIKEAAKSLNLEIHENIIDSEDVFYNLLNAEERHIRSGATCAEMEAFALFANAQKAKKNAACILTISDNLITHKETTAEERQHSFTNMMEVALKTVELLKCE